MSAFRLLTVLALLPLSGRAESGASCPYGGMAPGTERYFLQAVSERPDDPSAVAMLADFLMERGSPRGELITVSLDIDGLARRFPDLDRSEQARYRQLKQRSRELQTVALAEWAGYLAAGTDYQILQHVEPAMLQIYAPGATLDIRLDRWGIPSSLTGERRHQFEGARLTGREIFALVEGLPIRSVVLHPSVPSLDTHFSLQGLEGTALAERLVSVRFVGGAYDPSTLVRHSDAFPRLRDIVREAGEGTTIGLEPYARLLTLENLSLSSSSPTRLAFDPLASPGAPRLRTLTVVGDPEDASFGRWLRSPAVSELRSLVVHSRHSRGWQGAVATSPSLSRLESFETGRMTAAELRAILRSPHLRALKTIRVDFVEGSDVETSRLIGQWKSADRSRNFFTITDGEDE